MVDPLMIDLSQQRIDMETNQMNETTEDDMTHLVEMAEEGKRGKRREGLMTEMTGEKMWEEEMIDMTSERMTDMVRMTDMMIEEEMINET